MNPVIRARKQLILRIAEELQTEFGLNTKTRQCWDLDDACKIIDMELPQTYDEVEATSNTASTYVEVDRVGKPTILAELREALGLADERIPLIQIIKAAVEHINASK